MTDEELLLLDQISRRYLGKSWAGLSVDEINDLITLQGLDNHLTKAHLDDVRAGGPTWRF